MSTKQVKMSIVKTIKTVKTEDELNVQISGHLEEIKRLVHNYAQYITRKATKRSHSAQSSQSNQPTTKPSGLVSPDTICLAMLKTGNRCTKKRSDEGPDLELCKLHNGSRYVGQIAKFEEPPAPLIQSVPTSEVVSSSSSPSPNGDLDTSASETDGFIQIKLSVDADGDTIDQEGNIWCMDKQDIIGKKDLRTKHKVFFKSV